MVKRLCEYASQGWLLADFRDELHMFQLEAASTVDRVSTLANEQNICTSTSKLASGHPGDGDSNSRLVHPLG